MLCSSTQQYEAEICVILHFLHNQVCTIHLYLPSRHYPHLCFQFFTITVICPLLLAISQVPQRRDLQDLTRAHAHVEVYRAVHTALCRGYSSGLAVHIWGLPACLVGMRGGGTKLVPLP